MPMLLADSPASLRYGKEKFWIGFSIGMVVGGSFIAIISLLATLWR